MNPTLCGTIYRIADFGTKIKYRIKNNIREIVKLLLPNCNLTEFFKLNGKKGLQNRIKYYIIWSVSETLLWLSW